MNTTSIVNMRVSGSDLGHPLLALSLVVSACGVASNETAASTEATAESTGVTSDAPEINCVDPGQPAFTLAMLPAPPQDGIEDTFSIEQACAVSESADASLALACDTPTGPVAFSLSVVGEAPISFTTLFAVDDVVELEYATIRWPSGDLAWAAIRTGAGELSLAAVSGWQPLPWFDDHEDQMSPLTFELLGATTCEISEGPCGPLRRAAVGVAAEDGASVVVFDENTDAVGGFRIDVGEATYEDGECEGLDDTRYEFLVTRI